MAFCDLCGKKWSFYAVRGLDSSFSIVTESILDWMIVIPKNEADFIYNTLCHSCIEDMVFQKNTLLLHGDTLNGTYDFVSRHPLHIVSPDAKNKYQKEILAKINDICKRIPFLDLTDEELGALIKMRSQYKAIFEDKKKSYM